MARSACVARVRSPCRSRARRSGFALQRGFSLLEAIVALVLFAAVGLAILDWINGNVAALARIQDANRRSEATMNILEHMHAVNPMLTPKGSADMASFRIAWDASPLTLTVDRSSSNYQYALFESRIDVLMPDGSRWFDFTLRQVGYRRVRSAGEGG